MKYANKRNQTPLIVALSVTAALLLAAIVAILLLDSGETRPQDPVETTAATEALQTQPEASETTPGQPETTAPTETAVPTETAAPTDASVPETEPDAPTEKPEEPTAPAVTEDLAIDTPYATLYFPGQWRDYLSMKITEGDLYRVTFVAKLPSGKTQNLFCVGFGGSAETAIGRVKTPNGEYANVQVEIYDFTPDGSWSGDERDVVEAMRDAADDVLRSLALEEIPPEQPTTPPGEGDADIVIHTAYGKLHYPAQWEDTLKLVEEDNAVHFYCALEGGAEQWLFSVYFGGDKGVAISTVRDANGNTLEVRIDVAEIDPDPSWTQEQTETVLAMQEELNYLLEHLA